MEKAEQKLIIDSLDGLGKKLDQVLRAIQIKPREFSKPILFSTFDGGLVKTANEMGFKAVESQSGVAGTIEVPSFNDLMRVLQALEEKDVTAELALQIGSIAGSGLYSVEVVSK